MSFNFVLGDLIARIRNASMVKKKSITTPYYQNLSLAVLKILKDEGFILDFSIVADPSKDKDSKLRAITIFLKYVKNLSSINEIGVISKPGRRIFLKKNEIKPFKSGLGFYILSTSSGVMTDRVAKELGIGGELLFSVF
jgi:small subunit ribosomal protein S8